MFKRKLDILDLNESFFELHNCVTGQEKDNI